MASYLAANTVWVNCGALCLLVPGRLNTQTFVIDPLSDSEWNDCIHERLMTEPIPIQPWKTWSMFKLSQHLFQIPEKCFIDVNKLRCARVCVHVRVCFGMWARRTGDRSRGKEGHGITYPQSVIEYGRLRVMLESVRSLCPFSFSVCPAWNFCLILRWGEEAVINTPQYLPCPLVLRESFTASLLRSYVNQNVHQKPFATLSTACKYMCTCKQPWQA